MRSLLRGSPKKWLFSPLRQERAFPRDSAKKEVFPRRSAKKEILLRGGRPQAAKRTFFAAGRGAAGPA